MILVITVFHSFVRKQGRTLYKLVMTSLKSNLSTSYENFKHSYFLTKTSLPVMSKIYVLGDAY